MLELATAADREHINRLAWQLYSLRAGWRPDLFEQCEELYSEERLLHLIKDRQLYTAKIGGEIIGYVRVHMEKVDAPGLISGKRMFIDELCVEELFRDQGFGTKMMEDVRALARVFRCNDLQLSVFPQNDDAVGFWQKCGFTIRSIEMQRNV